jgi:hypothetical protein
MFLEGEDVILNALASTGLPNRVGENCQVQESLYNSPNYDYKVVFEDGETAKVKESELNKLTEKDKHLQTYIKRGNELTYIPTSENVVIETVDYLHGQAEVRFNDNGVQVVGFESLRPIDKENDSVDNSYTHDDLLEVFFGHYRNENDTYTVPKEFLINILKQFTE